MAEITIRENRLVFSEEPIPFEEWLALGRARLAPALNKLLWVVGDWLFHAEGEYRGRDREGYELLGLDIALLEELRDVSAAAYEVERDLTIPWGKYLLALKRDGSRLGNIEEDLAEIAAAPAERCGGCRRPLYSLTKHERKYCSSACRQRAYRKRNAVREHAVSARENAR